MKQIPVAAIIAAVVLALGLLGYFVVKAIKSDDTQGTSYGSQADYRKRMAEKMGSGGGSSSYGQGKPNAAPGGPGGGRSPQQQMMEQRAKQMGGSGGQ
jgi:hypothetical protein